MSRAEALVPTDGVVVVEVLNAKDTPMCRTDEGRVTTSCGTVPGNINIPLTTSSIHDPSPTCSWDVVVEVVVKVEPNVPSTAGNTEGPLLPVA